MKRRVVVTGLGVVSPFGAGLDVFWSQLTRGASAVRRITRFDASPFPSQIAAAVTGFNPEAHLPRRDVVRTDTFIHFALTAAIVSVAFAAGVTRIYMWWGGVSAPARFLVPLVPLAAPMLAVGFDRVSRSLRGPVIAALALSVGICGHICVSSCRYVSRVLFVGCKEGPAGTPEGDGRRGL